MSKTNCIICEEEMDQNDAIATLNGPSLNICKKCLEDDTKIAHSTLVTTNEIELCNDSPKIAKAFFNENFPNQRQKDLLYIKLKLVHANTNGNKDQFLKDELRNSEATPILKLVNWNHKEPNIGVIYASKYIESDNPEEVDYLECYAAISKLKYKSHADEIIKRYNEGTLSFSMEVFFKEAQCSRCSSVFDGEEDTYCNHLQNRFSEASSASRILKGLVFAGCAVADIPADIQANALAMASKNEEVTIVSDRTYSQAEVNDLLAKAREDAIKESQASQEYEDLKNTIADLEGKNDVLAKANTDFETQVKTLNESLSTASTELEKVKNEYDLFVKQTKAREITLDRLNQLAEAGYQMPDRANEDEYTKFISSIESMDENIFSLFKSLAEKTRVSSASQTSTENVEETDDDDVPLTHSTTANLEDEFEELRGLTRKLFGRKIN